MTEYDFEISVAVPRREDGKYLLLQRAEDRRSPRKWTFPGGIIEEESPREAAIRELGEETSLKGEVLEASESFERTVRGKKHLAHFFLVEADDTDMELNEEHRDYDWIKIPELDDYETVGDYTGLKRLGVVNGKVALAVVENNDEFLIVQRSEENTSSGFWGFVSGRIENGESPEEAAVRELKEETGIDASAVEKGEEYIGEGETGYWLINPVLLETDERDVDLNWELSDYEWIEPEELENWKTLGDESSVEKLGLV